MKMRMMKKLIMVTIFIIVTAVFILGVFTGVTWGKYGNTYTGILLEIIIGGVLALLALGLVFRDRDRWLAFTLASVVFIELSFSYVYGSGILGIPIGLFLFGVSLRKLARYTKVQE